MTEAVVSVALETLRDLLLEEGRFLLGVGGEVKALQVELTEAKCLLRDADKKQHESESESKSVRDWIMEIRDLAYRAEDVILEYAVRMSSDGPRRGLKRLLAMFACYSLHQLGSEISDIKSELSRVTKSMQEYGIRSIIGGAESFEIEDCFVGKEDDLKRLEYLLVEDKQHRVISVWGMGGIGKTIIAKKVYNHLIETKNDRFDSFAWVCITQQCRIRSVLEDVLVQLDSQTGEDVSNLSDAQLVEKLCEIQRAKCCMIVLDDLWETSHWDGMKHAFLVRSLQSKILVTTRIQKVAEIRFSQELGLLNVDDGWKLLKKKAFPHNIPGHISDDQSLSTIINAIATEWNKLSYSTILIRQGCKLMANEEGLKNLKQAFSCPHLYSLRKLLEECIRDIISSKLVKLSLIDSEMEDDPMGILGKLPSLRELYLDSRSFVGEEMTCPASSFPQLKKVVLQSLPNLREWRVEQGAMPVASEICLRRCPRLESVPHGLSCISTLKKLVITRMPKLGKRVLASGQEGVDFHKVSHIPSIIIN